MGQILDATTEAIRAFCAPPDCEHERATPIGEVRGTVANGAFERRWCADCLSVVWVPVEDTP